MAKYIMCDGDSADRIKPEHARKYKSLCKQMQKLLDDISVYEQDVNLYVEDSNNWNLMVGPSHSDDRNSSDLQENVALACTVSPSGGGGW
jgi:hypothetical protein